MILRYDKTADALYIGFSDEMVARTEELDPGTMIDLDRMGSLVGIEVIRPARPWPLTAILERFDLPDGDVRMVRDLWSEGATYPFAEPASLAS